MRNLRISFLSMWGGDDLIAENKMEAQKILASTYLDQRDSLKMTQTLNNLPSSGSVINEPFAKLTEWIYEGINTTWLEDSLLTMAYDSTNINAILAQSYLAHYYDYDFERNPVMYDNNTGSAKKEMEDITGDIIVYPNPANDIIIIDTGLESNPVFFSLYDYTGKQVLRRNINGHTTMSIDELPSGVYIYEINGTSKQKGKLVIIR